MYWFRTSVDIGPVLLAAMLGIWLAAGWMLASASFRLRVHEQLVVGIALGMTLSVWLSNLIGRWLPPEFAFWGASFLVLVLGIMAARLRRIQVASALYKWRPWAVLGVTAVLAAFLVLIGRGVGVFDDRKNLSYISTMAAGDIPPHFYMNPDLVPSYHYGFQLIGASLVRNAGMLPWSAFDVAKGFVGSLAISLAAMLGWRLTHSASGAGLTALLVTFASGGRWMLLLLPQSLIRAISDKVTLWGSGAASADSLIEALGSSWNIEGGPPVAIPFAFVSGILQPFILGLQAGPGAFSLMILFLVLILLQNVKNSIGWMMLAAVFAAWALASEAHFALYSLGLIAMAGLSLVVNPRSRWRRSVRKAALAVVAAGIISLIQGGTLTEIGRGIFATGGKVSGSGGVAGFSLRWPPALVSSHLGELRLFESEELLAGVFEMGPALLAAPLVLWLCVRWGLRGRFELTALGIATVIGVLIPIFLRFRVDRDITRLTAFSLVGWSILAIPGVLLLLRARRSAWLRWVFSGWLATMILGGVIVLGSLLTALPRAMLSTDISPLDAKIADQFWGELEPGSLILDSHPWRAVALTGRPTRSSPNSLTTLPEFDQLVAEVDLLSARRSGYGYVYVDENWWQRMGEVARTSFSDPCVSLLRLEVDDQPNVTRRLFDIRACDKG